GLLAAHCPPPETGGGEGTAEHSGSEEARGRRDSGAPVDMLDYSRRTTLVSALTAREGARAVLTALAADLAPQLLRVVLIRLRDRDRLVDEFFRHAGRMVTQQLEIGEDVPVLHDLLAHEAAVPILTREVVEAARHVRRHVDVDGVSGRNERLETAARRHVQARCTMRRVRIEHAL